MAGSAPIHHNGAAPAAAIDGASSNAVPLFVDVDGTLTRADISLESLVRVARKGFVACFAVMLIGMGDYGILWVTHFESERRAGRDVAAANRATAATVGPSILVAACTTALAFFAA